jgi:DDE superfamily endonuclease
VIRRHRRQIGSPSRKLNPRPAGPAGAGLPAQGETLAELAARFGAGTAAAWRYVTQTVALLAAPAPKLRQALRHAAKAGYARLVTDGTLIPVDRVAADRPFCCRKHRKDRMNLQVMANPGGDIVGVPGPLPGAVHDLITARNRGIIGELAAWGLVRLGDKGSIGEDDIRTRAGGGTRPALRKDANRGHARLTSWRIVRKLRCCPWRAGHLATAIYALRTREIGGRKPFKEV